MTELKREYVIPLRRKSRTAPKWRRSKKAVVVLKDFIRKHMKTEDVIVCNDLNDFIWARGIKNPPSKVNVIALKTEINGTEMTVVNLLDKGLDKQMALYAASQTPSAELEEDTSEVVDAQAEEKEEAKEDSTSKKATKKSTAKKTTTKKEVKSNE